MRFVYQTTASGALVLTKVRDNGSTRFVGEDDPSYLEWVSHGNTVEVLPYVAPVGPTLAEAKAAKQAEIRDKADVFLAPFGQEYGTWERQTWEQQSKEAHAHAANPQSEKPLLAAIAASRGMDVATLAARVITNEQNWKIISGHVVGQRLAYQDALEAITGETPEAISAVQAITVTYALPEA